ncbi:MAG: DUF5591 domain-containing protein [Thermoplasmata archaeon]
MIEIIKRDGLARILNFNGEEYPKYLKEDELHEYDTKINERFEVEINNKILEKENIIIIPGSFTKFKDPENFVKTIMEIRKKYKDKILYLPASVYAETIPSILYLGVDMIDDLLPKFIGSWNENYSKMFDYYYKISIKAIKENRLRTLVETIPNTFSKTVLRLLDFNYHEELEKYYPVSDKWLNASHFESLFRPEVERWRKRIIERYRKPDGRDCLLFLPCSAVKPYSKSKSHRYYKKLIESTNSYFHEVILTSPLGIVPRELENTFPAQSYDIPVTGRWYEDEKFMLIEMVKRYLKINKYNKKYAFLNEDLGFLKDIFDDENIEYYFGNLHSDEAKNWFKKTVDGCSKKPLIQEDINSISSYQFGVKFEMSGKRVKFIQDDIFIFDEEEFLRFNKNIGKIYPMKLASETLYENNIYYIKIDFEPKGIIYIPGIIESSNDFRIGDIVAILKDNDIIGIGESLISSEDIKTFRKGKAVEVKKKFN